MKIETTHLKRCDLVALQGRFDSSTAPDLEEALRASMDEGIYQIVLDMEKSASEMIYFLAARKFTPADQGAVSALTATPTEESAIDNATISDEMDDDKQKDL